ncbi:transposase [Geomonas subterranea]|uniref:Transposase n=1 Tax=Geomonas subterranea TaxID=2847989 RepID=A0ABX8LLR0_9BACT|nr:transposase [Geomonas subterranea]QXE92276.1 transposase [Geomonas subterranea]QXM09625.1 transposase [Geomonas subterranea]
MPRIARGLSDGFLFHVLNRGNARQEVFHKNGDYYSFLMLIEEAVGEFDIGVLAYCLMPNHFHFLINPGKAQTLGKFMQWLLTSHVRRYHQHYGTCGHVWQGRYKSFIVQEDDHLLTVMRYIEGNPVRANLVKSSKNWKWSSHVERLGRQPRNIIDDAPIALPADWTSYVDDPMTANEVERLRRSVNRHTPFGADAWVETVCGELGLESTLHPRGRPKKEK